MLILTRRVGEKVVINNNIIVEVLEFNSRVVRLGFNAPDNIAIDREEIYESKKKNREIK